MEISPARALSEADIGILSGAFLFTSLHEADRRRAIASVSPYSIRFPTGDTIVEAGAAFSAIGIISEGKATVIRSGERRPVIHKTLMAGDVFGVSSLFDAHQGFPTTIKADEDCAVIFLSEKDVLALLETFPQIAKSYIALLTKKIRFLNHRLDTLAGRSAEERVAEHLLTEIGTDGTLGITKSALASMLGLGRASLYRILDLFEESGFIRTARDRIEILDPQALKLFIENRKEP